jgi:hypothetical protein
LHFRQQQKRRNIRQWRVWRFRAGICALWIGISAGCLFTTLPAIEGRFGEDVFLARARTPAPPPEPVPAKREEPAGTFQGMPVILSDN